MDVGGNGSGGLTGAEIAGIVVGCLAATIIIVLVILFVMRKRGVHMPFEKMEDETSVIPPSTPDVTTPDASSPDVTGYIEA